MLSGVTSSPYPTRHSTEFRTREIRSLLTSLEILWSNLLIHKDDLLPIIGIPLNDRNVWKHSIVDESDRSSNIKHILTLYYFVIFSYIFLLLRQHDHPLCYNRTQQTILPLHTSTLQKQQNEQLKTALSPHAVLHVRMNLLIPHIHLGEINGFLTSGTGYLWRCTNPNPTVVSEHYHHSDFWKVH